MEEEIEDNGEEKEGRYVRRVRRADERGSYIQEFPKSVVLASG